MEQLFENQPRVIFVTGGPGTGKGTQCPKLVEEFGYKHISIGDLMRAEIKSGSEEGKNIVSIVQSGGLVPKELTVSLLQKSLSSISAHTILVDGFPRSVDQAIYLEQTGVKVNFLLHFDTDKEDVLLNRLIERGKISGRADDNEETIVKRFRVYKSESLPVLQLYEPFGIVHKVNCMGTINEVFFRTLCALRPELLFVAGTKSSGKSTLSSLLSSRYYYFNLDIQRIVHKSDGSDESITRKLVQTLQKFKHVHRVLVDGFPQNENQARLFTGLLGLPNKVIHLECPPDVCQERQLAVGKKNPGYIPSINLSREYSESVKTYSALCQYYNSTLTSHFKKIQSVSVEQVNREAAKFVEPEVLLVRGNIRPSFLLHFKERGFKLVNAIHLMELWRNARGQSVSENQTNLSDDPEQVEVLKDLIFSGNATEKFIIYNFALGNPDLIEHFEAKICKFTKVFQLFSNKEISLDRVNSYFCARDNFLVQNTEKVSYKRKLLLEDVRIIDENIENQSPATQSHFVVVLGPTLTGKTSVAKALQGKGMRIIDFAALVEDTKQRLSTEEEPKEDLNFSEILQGLQEEAKKDPLQVLIIDGIPPSEVLFAKDPAWPYPELSEEKTEEEFPYDEDPSIQIRVSATAVRMKALLSSIKVLTVVHFKVPYQLLEKRARKKFETPEEEDLNNEQKSEIFASWVTAQRLYSKPCPSKFLIPEVVGFNTEKISIPQITFRLKNMLRRKCILVESSFASGFDIIKKLALKNLIPCIDYSALNNENLTKLQVLQQRARSLPPRSRYVILVNFPFKLQEHESILQDFSAIEDTLGRLHIFYIFSNKEVDSEMPEISPSPRKNEPHSIMWNNGQQSSQYKLFMIYKGEKSETHHKYIDYNNYSNVFTELEETVDNEKRIAVQFILDESSARGFQSYLNEGINKFCGDFKEKLFLDLSTVDTRKKTQTALKNSRAKDFHEKFLKVYTVPFCLFFEHFSKILKSEEIEITSGIRKSIKQSVDLNKNSFIDAEEISLFFDSWGIPEEREMLIGRGVSYDKREVTDKLGYSLILLVENVTPDPVTNCTSFNRGDIFEITFDGLKTSKRFCADRTVYFGKENPQFKNDVEFNSADTRVGLSHFQIHSKKTGYCVVDNSNQNIMKLKVYEIPVTLFEDCLIYIGQHEIRVKTLISTPIQEDEVISLNFRGKAAAIDTRPVLELEFLSEALFGMKFVNAGKKVITIGSGANCDLVVYGVSPVHAVIELRKGGWCILDNHTVKGTKISINTYFNISYKKPSSALNIVNGMRFEVAGVSLRLLHKSSDKLKIELNDFQELRSEKFLDFYSIVQHLEKSIIGERYLVQHLQSKKHYIAKLIHTKDLNSNLAREVGILKSLDHPNTIKVIDTIVDSGKLFIIFEHCTGPDLLERIMSKGSHSEEHACKYIKQVLQGLAYLHNNELLCRDLRPENLKFFDETEESALKICEFANSIDSKGFADKIVSTSHYLAPEVFSNIYTKASDIWSCGILLYTLLVGVPPFVGKTDSDVRKKIVKGVLGFKEKAWARVSNHAKRVVRLMLTLDQSKRPTADELLLDPWVKRSLKYLDLSKPMIARTFKNFKNFYSNTKMQNAIVMFNVDNVNNVEIKKQAAELFSVLDQNGDGKVSVQELVDSMRDSGMMLSGQELKVVVDEVDTDRNGWVDFDEFLNVFCGKKALVAKENLEKTFALFAADGNTEVMTNELKKVLGQAEGDSGPAKRVDDDE